MKLDEEYIEIMDLNFNNTRNLNVLIESVLLGAFKSACDGESEGYRFLNIVRNYVLDNGVVDTRYLSHEIKMMGQKYIKEKEKNIFREMIKAVNSHKAVPYIKDNSILIEEALSKEKLLEKRVEHSINRMALVLYAVEQYKI